MQLKYECLVLDGAGRNGIYTNLLSCPRAPETYWREVWLEGASAKAESLWVNRLECPRLLEESWKTQSYVQLQSQLQSRDVTAKDDPNIKLNL